MKRLALLALLFCGLPALNPAVTQATISETICARCWTKTVRLPSAVTNAIKLAKLHERGLTEADKSRFELDHKILLAIGGSPDDPPQSPIAALTQSQRKG